MFYECTSTVQSEGFRSLELIGAGTYGRVYSAYDDKLDCVVAIKKLDVSSSAQGDQFKREIAAIKKAKHRNIQPIFYAVVRPRMALLIMPVKQGNLHTIMPLAYEMTAKTSVFYSLAIQMLSALTYLQEEGVSHRNVKPTNILVETNRRGYSFQLTDFALTQPLTQAEIRSTAYVYKAPETYIDTYPLTTKQDVWSLFVTLAIACGQLSETELSRKVPGAAARAIVEAGVQMAELEAMAQQNPTLRTSASVLFHQLRPKERVDFRGSVDYPEVSPEYFGLYGSGRLERDAVIPLGPNADVRKLTGPLGLELPLTTALGPVPGQYTFLPPVSDSDVHLFEHAATAAVDIPKDGMFPSSQTSYFGQVEHVEQYPITQYDPVEQRCLASCCNTPRSLSWASHRRASYNMKPLSPYAPTFFPPLAPTPTEPWDIWGVYDFGAMTTSSLGDASHVRPNIVHKTKNGVAHPGWEYVRPYPLACDGQDQDQDQDQDAEVTEGQQLLLGGDGFSGDLPWHSPRLNYRS